MFASVFKEAREQLERAAAGFDQTLPTSSSECAGYQSIGPREEHVGASGAGAGAGAGAPVVIPDETASLNSEPAVEWACPTCTFLNQVRVEHKVMPCVSMRLWLRQCGVWRLVLVLVALALSKHVAVCRSQRTWSAQCATVYAPHHRQRFHHQSTTLQ